MTGPRFKVSGKMAETCGGCLRRRARCTCARYCRECGCVTNHSTRQHQEAVADQEEEP